MVATMAVMDRFFPSIEKRVETFGVQSGMTIVDYGCGPGRYATRFARLVGSEGKVYAVDVQPLALEYVKRRMQKERLDNIVPVVADGYRSTLPDRVADMIFALDMVAGVNDPTSLLHELHRLALPEGILVVDDNHRPRAHTIQMIKDSGKWTIETETPDHLRCVPVVE